MVDVIMNPKKPIAKIINKTEFIECYKDKIKQHSPTCILQSSSGTTGEPFLISRTPADIMNIMQRVLSSYVTHYAAPPKNVALMGGISHTEAALNLKLSNIKIQSFSIDQLNELQDFVPEVISAYPSIIREILSTPKLEFPSLKAIKLGGEPLFATDINKIFDRFPNIIIIEQYGSTEMPALALRVFKPNDREPRFELETERFEFLVQAHDNWQSIIVKDNFKESLFNIDAFYDTGDEGIFINNQLVKLRRRNNQHEPYLSTIEALLKQGCVNVQLLLKAKQLRYSSTVDLHARIEIGGDVYQCVQEPLQRLPQSNKLPLVL